MRSFWFSYSVAFWAPVDAVVSPEFWQHEWPETDFSQTTVESWVEVLSSFPPKDGSPSLIDPQLITAFSDNQITDREPVISV